jgi:hypothetical protein
MACAAAVTAVNKARVAIVAKRRTVLKWGSGTFIEKQKPGEMRSNPP